MTTVLPLSEVFGPTFQGEGPHAGRRAGFVRLGLCNLSCEWCDTPYTWDSTRYNVREECPDTPISEAHASLEAMDVPLVVLTGGEPLIHKTKLQELLDQRWEWHVETNGTISPPLWWPERVTHTTVSPKVGTRDPLSKRIKPYVLRQWDQLGATFKFVCRDESDLLAADAAVAESGISPDCVWIMPEGTSATDLLATHKALAPDILARGYNTTTRLHALLWGDERGR